MFLKRQMPLVIAISVGLFTLFGHFIKNDGVQNFVDNDATQWFDIIASFAIFLGSLNMLKLQLIKILKKQKNWQYSILAVLGFMFAIFAGFFYRGANFVELSNIERKDVGLIVDEVRLVSPEIDKFVLKNKMLASLDKFEIPLIFKSESGAESFRNKVIPYCASVTVGAKKWGAHISIEGSLFSWMFFNIFTPLSSTMFALLAFFVASASYRAFRIRNFEATLLLVAGIILMLGRVPIGELIPWWMVSTLMMFGIGALIAPIIPKKQHLFSIILVGIISLCSIGFYLDWSSLENIPYFLSIPNLSQWIFDYPTAAGSRAIMIGIALGIIATSFRIILGIERPF